MLLWDSAYNNSPGSGLPKSLIDDEIRRIKQSIRERMEIEHIWTGDSGGSHIPGGTTVMDKGDDTAMAAISNPGNGALFLLEDDTDLQIHYYNSEWIQVSTLDHLALTGIEDNDHPDLLLKDGGILSGNLDMGGYKISTSGTGSTYGDFLIYGHKAAGHTLIGNILAIKNDSVGQSELKVTQVETSKTLADGEVLHIDNIPPGLTFIPQVYVKSAFNADIVLRPSTNDTFGWEVANFSGSPVDVRVRQEAIVA